MKPMKLERPGKCEHGIVWVVKYDGMLSLFESMEAAYAWHGMISGSSKPYPEVLFAADSEYSNGLIRKAHERSRAVAS